MSVGAVFAIRAVAQTFSVIPTFAERENGWQSFRRHCLAQKLSLMLEIAREPAVADFINWDNVDGFINVPFGDNAQGSVSTDCLNIHSGDFETSAFQQHAIINQLNSPIKQISHAVIAKLGTEFRLSLLEPRFIDFAGVDFDFVNPQCTHELERGRNF